MFAARTGSRGPPGGRHLLQEDWRAAWAALQAAAKHTLPPSTATEAGGSAGGGGRPSGAGARQRAERYVRDKERAAADAAEAGAPRSRLAEAAAEFSSAQQQACLLSAPGGLGVGAEAAIARSIAEGALDNLKGRGQPLPQEDHSAQFGRVDPLVAAVTRTMGAQGVRPPSLDLRDELAAALRALRHVLHAELRAALQAQQRRETGDGGGGGASSGRAASQGSATAAGGGGDGSAQSAGSWLPRLFAAARPPAATSSDASSPTVDSVRAAPGPALQHAADEVRALTRQYNSAVLADKEALGSRWPLEMAKPLDWAAEVEAALAAARRSLQPPEPAP